MTKEVFGRQFGDSTFMGDNGDAFFALPAINQAQALGQSEACPVVNRLIKPPTEGGRGAEVMRNRYAEVLFWFGYIRDVFTKDGRQDLAQALTQVVERNTNEPLGVHDVGWIPEELHTHTFRSPMAYALPRITTEYMAVTTDKAEKADRMVAVTEYLEQALRGGQTYDLLEITTYFLELVVSDMLADGQREKAGLLLRNLIGLGKLNEDNQFHLYRKIFANIKRLAPMVWNFYEEMTPDERISFRLVERTLLPQDLPVVQLPLKVGERVVNTAPVQFSHDEIAQIEDIRAFRELAFAERAMKGSGWERDFFLNTELPWGFTLRNRETALATYRKALLAIEVLERRFHEGGTDNQYTQALSVLKTKIAGFVRTADLE